jgi:hypothetical protein
MMIVQCQVVAVAKKKSCLEIISFTVVEKLVRLIDVLCDYFWNDPPTTPNKLNRLYSEVGDVKEAKTAATTITSHNQWLLVLILLA